MDEATYWSLVDTLGGVADDDSVARLETALAGMPATEQEAFADLTDSLVEALLAGCPVPPSHHGDTAEWIAAAVIAAGRSTYERLLAEGAALDPDAWSWQESEVLLVAGLADHGEAEDLADRQAPAAAGVVLTWLAQRLPPGFEEVAEQRLLQADLGIDEDDLSYGFEPFPDPEWDATWAELPTDSDVPARLAALEASSLQIAVGDLDEPEVLVEERHRIARLKVPVTWILAEDSRRVAYAGAVLMLLEALED